MAGCNRDGASLQGPERQLTGMLLLVLIALAADIWGRLPMCIAPGRIRSTNRLSARNPP
jgi:hypothetical protein